MSTSEITHIEAGNRIQIPAEWVQALGLRDRVVLDRTPEGILIRPQPAVTWDDIFAEKLVIGSNTEASDEIEVFKDDLLF
jgi:bifunctional DNA-binding transcriptional regulator/antitoxin component of YhaV-PrlF toxin-antitoxin module